MTSTPEGCDFLPNTSDLLQVSATYTYTWHDDDDEEEEEEEEDDKTQAYSLKHVLRALCPQR